MTSVPNEAQILGTGSLSMEGFFLEGFSLGKMAKAISILSSRSVKLVKHDQEGTSQENIRSARMDKVCTRRKCKPS